MTFKQSFTVTEKAGHFVAGMRNPGVNETLLLTNEQAELALILGEIKRSEELPAAEPVITKSKKG